MTDPADKAGQAGPAEANTPVIHIPRSKRDKERCSADITLPRRHAPDTCPIRAIETWLRRARITGDNPARPLDL